MLAISSCQVKEEGELAPEGKTFTATMEAMADDATVVDTKTSMDSYGNVLWKKGDQVSIFVASTINQHFQVTDASDGKTAAALNPVESPGFVAGGDIPNNVAYYPYAATAAIAKRDGGAYLISDIALPAAQNYAEASFGNGAFPMTAVTSSTNDYNLKFKNVLGGLKLQLKGNATITSISITGNNNEVLCGAAEVTVSAADTPAITLTDATGTIVTLDCGDGVQLNAETATTFIIALPPMTMTGGFTVIVTDTENKQMEIKTTKSQTITRSNLLSMPAVIYEGSGSNPVSEPVAVDLGLPSGLKWASFNLGASAPEEYGDYFAWGETEPYYEDGYAQSENPVWKEGKTGYNWASYKWCNGTRGSQTKYCTNPTYGYVDNKTLMEADDDAAHVNLGGFWRIPSFEEWIELFDNCDCIATDDYNGTGVAGRIYVSRKPGYTDKSIFLPEAGYRDGTVLYMDGGQYLSSSINNHYSYMFNGFSFSGWGMSLSWYPDRCKGFPVRAVSMEGIYIPVTNIEINKISLTLRECEGASLTATVTPLNATWREIIWSSSNTDIATVDHTGVVAAVNTGTATITATTYDGGKIATCSVTVVAGEFIPQAVDLGLASGIKWANSNLCETGLLGSPWEFGDYYAWGETEPYYSSRVPLIWKDGKTDGYTWTSYKWCSGSSDSLIKYNTSSSSGIVDNKTVLELDDDVANIKLGGSWRVPTDEEWNELCENCTWTWISRNGVGGYIIIGPNEKSIFLPAAGRFINAGFWNNDAGFYWSSSLLSANIPLPDVAGSAHFQAGGIIWSALNHGDDRREGISIRPVTE